MSHRVRALLATRLGEVAAEVVDLSMGGLGVEISGELRSYDFVRVLLPLAPDDDTSEWVVPDAVVTRVQGKTGSGRTRLGLSFFRLPPDTLQRIAACIAKRPELPPPAPMRAPRAEPKRPTPSASIAAPQTSEATTWELPKASPGATPNEKSASSPASPPARPPESSLNPRVPPLHIPRASARELRDLFHDALASLEEDNGRED